MNNLRSISLDMLLTLAHRLNLVTGYRTTQTVVYVVLDDQELVMKHDAARYFMQGLIYGAAIKWREKRDPADVIAPWMVDVTETEDA